VALLAGLSSIHSDVDKFRFAATDSGFQLQRTLSLALCFRTTKNLFVWFGTNFTSCLF
jgi:hypothetical protein